MKKLLQGTVHPEKPLISENPLIRRLSKAASNMYPLQRKPELEWDIHELTQYLKIFQMKHAN